MDFTVTEILAFGAIILVAVFSLAVSVWAYACRRYLSHTARHDFSFKHNLG